jgi:hypothetical protein
MLSSKELVVTNQSSYSWELTVTRNYLYLVVAFSIAVSSP